MQSKIVYSNKELKTNGSLILKYEHEFDPQTLIIQLFLTILFLSLLINNLVNYHTNLKTIGFFGAFAIFSSNLIKNFTTQYVIHLDNEKLIIERRINKIKRIEHSINLKDIIKLKINPAVDGNTYWNIGFTKIYDKTKETLTITHKNGEFILGKNYRDFNTQDLIEKINSYKK